MGTHIPGKRCGRWSGEADMEGSRRGIVAADPPLCSEIPRRVRQALDWTDALGRPKRYLIHQYGGVLVAIGFSAAAWRVAARDRLGQVAETLHKVLARQVGNRIGNAVIRLPAALKPRESAKPLQLVAAQPRIGTV